MAKNKEKPVLDNNKNEKRSKPYSYHTFIFPFLWNDSGRVSMKKFRQCIADFWIPETLKTPKTYDADPQLKMELYNQYHYFNPAVKNAIYTHAEDENPIVETFVCDFDKLNPGRNSPSWKNTQRTESNPYKYEIRKTYYNKKGEEDGVFCARLCINEIRLKLFSTGIGMMIFELENYTLAAPEDINKINDYGRRIYKPYIAPHKNTPKCETWACNLCADSIAILRENGKQEIPYAKTTLNGVKVNSPFDTQLVEPILKLLTNGEYKVSTTRKKDKHIFFIEPIIDDRMFVACFYTNRAIIDRMRERCGEDYRYLHDADHKAPGAQGNEAREWYQLVFVDGEYSSCYNRTMLRSMLEEHTYDRWLELGTVTGITEYSMICVCSDENYENHLDAPFLTMYLEMAILALAQRATLLSFERRISDASCGRQKIRRVKKDYIMFQSRLLLQEVTPQQQGIEIYDMLLKNLYISKLRTDIEAQIEALFALENNFNEKSDNVLLAFLAALGIFDVIGFAKDTECSLWTLAACASALGIFLLFFILRKLISRRQ